MADTSLTADQILQKLFDSQTNSLNTYQSGSHVTPISIAVMPMTPTVSNDRNSDTVVITSTNVLLVSALVAVANPNRKGMRIYNNSANSVYICAVAAGASSATNLFAIVPTFAAFEFSSINYRGPVSAIRNAGSGTVIVTEFI